MPPASDVSYDWTGNCQIPTSCTIFTATIGDSVFFGNNEDYRLWGTYAWVVPRQEISTPSGPSTIYGAIFFGFDNNSDLADGHPQGGMNDQGLCLDGNGLGSYSLNPHYERPPPYASLLAELLWECGTINDVITWFQTHTIGSSMAYQLHFADITGDAVVVSAGPDNEIAFTRIEGATHLVSTNINVADPNRNVYDCWRYSTATYMLSSITSEDELTVEACRDVLDAVHQEGEYATKYSNIFDPVTRQIYLYNDRDFNNPATMSLNAELADVHPDAQGYYERDALFGAYGADGDIHYRQIKLTSLFTTTTLPPSLLPVILGISIIGTITIISTIIFYKRKRRIN
ncbi:MAG: hypothetical protein ACFFDP_08585 [Promethearchaeota archaeon]